MRDGVSLCWAVDDDVEVELAARRGGRLSRVNIYIHIHAHNQCFAHGKKLQLDAGLLATNVNISEIKRC
jgi:hypothetical protein